MSGTEEEGVVRVEARSNAMLEYLTDVKATIAEALTQAVYLSSVALHETWLLPH